VTYAGGVEPEHRTRPPERRGLTTPGRILLGALAVFGAITLVQWVLVSILAIVKFLLLIVVVLAVGAWVVGAKSSR
jgi:Flp pilus assembly protein TadB